MTCGHGGGVEKRPRGSLQACCLLPNRASFAPACLSHEIIIRRSVFLPMPGIDGIWVSCKHPRPHPHLLVTASPAL